MHGGRVARSLLKKARGRAISLIQRGGKSIDDALEHVALHFKRISGKEKHTMFLAKFRSKKAVTELITEALKNPSSAPALTRITLSRQGKQAGGEFAFIVEREFSEAIGEEVIEKGLKEGSELVAKKTNVLRVVIDKNGKLVTAYPITSEAAQTTVKWAGFRVAVTSGIAAGTVTYVAGEAEAYGKVLSKEAEAYQRDLEKFEEEIVESSWWEWLLPIGTESTRGGYEPDPYNINIRGENAVKDLENKLGVQLTQEEISQIKSDVRDIWLGR